MDTVKPNHISTSESGGISVGLLAKNGQGIESSQVINNKIPSGHGNYSSNDLDMNMFRAPPERKYSNNVESLRDACTLSPPKLSPPKLTTYGMNGGIPLNTAPWLPSIRSMGEKESSPEPKHMFSFKNKTP